MVQVELHAGQDLSSGARGALQSLPVGLRASAQEIRCMRLHQPRKSSDRLREIPAQGRMPTATAGTRADVRQRVACAFMIELSRQR